MELWLFFVACLTGGFILAMIGFSKFSDPYISRKWFFIGSLTLLAPIVLALILLAIDEIELSSTSPGITQFSFGLIFFEVIVIAALLFGRFGFAEARVTRNSTLGCSIFLFIQLIIGFLIVTILMGYSEPTRWRGYDKKFNDFGYKEVAGQIAITAYLGKEKIAEIPSTIDGKSVTMISESAFSSNHSITGVVIPDSVTSIDSGAFSSCLSLTGITIPEGVTNIEDLTFSDCSLLTTITIPDGVTSIGDWAFRGCNSLTIITIPKSVTSLGESLFFACNNMTDIEVSSDNPTYSSEAGILYNKDKTTVICCPPAKSGTVFLPDGVMSVNKGAFIDCSLLTTITIPDGVTSIGERTFGGCSSLTSVTIPDSVKSIGESAFGGCSSLTTITIPDGVTNIGESAFSWCSSLASITIPDSVTSIGDQAFYRSFQLVIHCPNDSYAQSYAVENEIEYVLTE